MISKEDIKQLEVIFPFWFELNQNDRAKIILSSRVLSLKKEAIFFNSHELDGLLFLKSGRLRFFLSSLDARDLPLYYLKDNEVEFFEDFNNKLISPILDIAFVVERNSEVLLIPYTILNLFRKKYSIMERFLHDLTREKLSKSLLSLQNILLIPLKERLLNFLYSLKKNEISLTHEEIAKKLGSSREVISRNLKILEKENFLDDDLRQQLVTVVDRFENPGLLKAISKNKRTFTSDDVQTAFNADALGVAMHLFVRKNKDDEESKEFYYLGPIHSTGQENAKEISMANGTAAVELEYVLEVPVRDDIYDYIVNG